jgi:SAM-dependent methyltransferase
MAAWHDQDEFWETVPMFGDQLWRVAPRQVDGIVALAGLAPGAAVLDLGCGVGRHSLELARRGFRVTAVDRTAAYLAEARQRAAAQDLHPEWVQADMRHFVRPGAFDAAINMCTSFGYFDEPAQNLQVARNLHRSLKPGGVLILETIGKEILARIFQPRDWQELPGGRLFLEERRVARDWTWMENRWIVVEPDGRRREFSVTHALYDGAGLRALLLQAGFASVDLHGGLDGEPYDTRAERLVAVARKAPS